MVSVGSIADSPGDIKEEQTIAFLAALNNNYRTSFK